MKIFSVLLMLASITACSTNEQYINSPSLPTELIGMWKYENKYINKDDCDSTYSPIVRHLLFESCEDSIELQNLPNTVIRMRKNNLLSGIRTREYDSLYCIIDTCYPVARIIIESSNMDTIVAVQSYGKKSKYLYHISKLRNDSLILGKCFLYTRIDSTNEHNSLIKNRKPLR